MKSSLTNTVKLCLVKKYFTMLYFYNLNLIIIINKLNILRLKTHTSHISSAQKLQVGLLAIIGHTGFPRLLLRTKGWCCCKTGARAKNCSNIGVKSMRDKILHNLIIKKMLNFYLKKQRE